MLHVSPLPSPDAADPPGGDASPASAGPRRIRPSRRWSARLLAPVLVGAALASGCAMLETKERELTWRPHHDTASWYSGLPADAQDFYLPVHSGSGTAKIHAWWLPAGQADAPAVLYLHGARWNLTGQLRRIEQLHDFGFAVLAIDYRGFGKSDGDLPSESTVYEDAEAAWAALEAREPDPAKRFIYGHSLGGAVAVDLAARLSQQGARAGGLIVESSFTTLADVAAAMSYEWLPIGLILSQKFDSVGKMANVHMPVLIVHGANDSYVPSRLSKALFAAAPEPKKLLLIDGASHNNSMWMGGGAYRAALAELFGLHAKDPAQTAGAARAPSPAPRRSAVRG